ncbi:MAG TPA: AAA family ATPase [Elusimicrobiota bacterium]|nr:AAA family ATPase [Elusimicrobiota bacterium]
MSLESIIGQPLAVDLVRRWLDRQTTQPLLFYGPEGVGKRRLALELAKALNCATGKGCEGCASCRKIGAGHHPDVRVLDMAWQASERGEPLAKQQALRIETLLSERRRLYQTSLEGRWKVGILDDAHRLTADAANVLLKVLEEPPDHTAIILVTPYQDRLFQTIVSRCQIVRFRPLSSDEMRACLRGLGMDPQTLTRMIELALGSPGRALHASREEQVQAHAEAEALWESLGLAAPATLLSRADGRSKAVKPGRAEMEDRLRALLVPASRSLRQGDSRAPESVRLIEDALEQLRQNVQPALVYDYALLKLARQRRPAEPAEATRRGG